MFVSSAVRVAELTNLSEKLMCAEEVFEIRNFESTKVYSEAVIF